MVLKQPHVVGVAALGVVIAVVGVASGTDPCCVRVTEYDTEPQLPCSAGTVSFCDVGTYTAEEGELGARQFGSVERFCYSYSVAWNQVYHGDCNEVPDGPWTVRGPRTGEMCCWIDENVVPTVTGPIGVMANCAGDWCHGE